MTKQSVPLKHFQQSNEKQLYHHCPTWKERRWKVYSYDRVRQFIKGLGPASDTLEYLAASANRETFYLLCQREATRQYHVASGSGHLAPR